MASPEARYAVWLVDPGPDRPGILGLIQEITGLPVEGAAGYLRDFPSLIAYFETETPARNLVDRFREFDAVAVVRPADRPLAPAPVEEVETLPAQRVVQILLVILGVVQLGVSVVWYREGHAAPAFFGLLLALYVLIYFGRRLLR